MLRKILFACLPLLLLFLLPFNIPLGSFYYTLQGYGTINRFVVVVAPLLTLVLLFDTFFRSNWLTGSRFRYMALGAGLVTTLLVRLGLYGFESRDYQEALALWYETIKANGGFKALSIRNFSDYNSSYLYIMAILSYLPVPALYAIKTVSVLFDYVAALAVYKLVKIPFRNGPVPVFAAFAFLMAPTVLFNGSLWAQCDVIYTSFLLWGVYAVVRKQNRVLALVLFSVSLMFKLQAVFIILLLVLLYTSKKINLWQILFVPAGIWLFTALPHFLLGRSLPDLLLIYARQVVRYPELSLNAPTVYQLVPGAPFEIFYPTGILAAAGCCLFFLLLFIKYPPRLQPESILQVTLISVMLLPWLLPKMHERYFFPADAFAIVYAFYRPNRWFVAVGMNLISLFSYLPYLFGQTPVPFAWLAAGLGALAGVVLYDFFSSLRKETVSDNYIDISRYAGK